MGTTLVMPPELALHTPAWLPNTAVPPVCRSPVAVLAARLFALAGIPSWIVSGVAPPSAQSCPRIVTPSRQRAARTNTRFARPFPAARAAMQKGMHGAVAMHAVSPLSWRSCPHLGTSHTAASSSRHVPLEMQSCVGIVVCAPVVPSVAVRLS